MWKSPTFAHHNHLDLILCSRAGGFENLNQGINIDFGAATTKVLELNVKIFLSNHPL